MHSITYQERREKKNFFPYNFLMKYEIFQTCSRKQDAIASESYRKQEKHPKGIIKHNNMKHEKQRIIKFVSNLGSDMIIATRYTNDTMFNHFRENYNLFAYKIPFFLQQFKEIYISTQ